MHPLFPNFFPAFLSGVLLAGCIPSVEESKKPTTSHYESTEEYEASLRMISAHGSLRRSEVLDPYSLSNRMALEAMLKKALRESKRQPSFIPPLQRGSSQIVGTLGGRFSVDNKGTGEITIPLPIPESRSTFSPYLTVSYSSRGTFSEAGRSFYLSHGFYKSITRGRSLIARDGNALGTEYSDKDKFYLGGKRLVCITGPDTHGRPGSRYRTEVDSFFTIEALGERNSIDSFRFTNKNGLVYTFGKYEDKTDALQSGVHIQSQVLGDVPSVFALKRVEDQYGDYIEYEYEHIANGEWLLRRIYYSASKELEPQFVIGYHYRALDHAAINYTALHRTDSNHIVDSVSVRSMVADEEVALFKFMYDVSPDDRVYRLTEIRPYLSSDLDSPLQSLSPTRLYWSNGFELDGSYVELLLPSTAESGTPMNGILGDFNGDKKSDFLTFENGISVFLSNANGFSTEADFEFTKKDTSSTIVAEIDGDGRDDVVLIESKQTLRVLRSLGNTFRETFSFDFGKHLKANKEIQVWPLLNDASGDGRYDLILLNSAGSTLYFESRGQSFKDPIVTEIQSVNDNDYEIVYPGSLNMNGDGNDDLVFIDLKLNEEVSESSSTLRLRYSLALPDGGFSPATTLHEWTLGEFDGFAGGALVSKDSTLINGDFNGDGLDDFLIGSDLVTSNPKWKVVLNKGHPTFIRKASEELIQRLSEGIPFKPGLSFPNADEFEIREFTLSPKHKFPLAYSDDSLIFALPHAGDLQSVDVNRDGYDDLIWKRRNQTSDSTHSWWARLSNADGTFSIAERLEYSLWNDLSGNTLDNRALFSRINVEQDVDGDGINDFLLSAINAEGQQSIRSGYRGANQDLSSCTIPNLMTGVVNGYGEMTIIDYKSGRDDRVYTPGADVSFPIREIRNFRPVVSDLWRDSGAGNWEQFSYQYSGERSDFSGRGGLGFASFITIDRQSGFISYQLLYHSFPMTGLNRFDQVYFSWQNEFSTKLKHVKTEEYYSAFDAVVDPYQNKYYGSLNPFTGQKVTYRWPDLVKGDYFFEEHELYTWDRGNPLFREGLHAQPESRIIESHWFDQQDLEMPPPKSPMDIRVPYALEETIPKEDFYLPGQITYGNNTRNLTDYGFGFFEEDRTRFKPPASPDDPFISLKTMTQSSEKLDQVDTQKGPILTQEYFPYSRKLLSKTVDTRHQSEGSDAQLTTTRYERDELGRLIKEVEEIKLPTDEAVEPVVTYLASDFDETTNRPQLLSYEDKENRWIRYHPLTHEAQQTRYGRGVTVVNHFDALGRKVRVINEDYGYNKREDFAWASPESSGWNKLQIVRPPKGIPGIVNESSYAHRIQETHELTTISYFDRMSRIIRTVTVDEEGNETCVDTIYDEKDYEVGVSNSYIRGGHVTWTKMTYDEYGNLDKELEVREEGRTGL